MDSLLVMVNTLPLDVAAPFKSMKGDEGHVTKPCCETIERRRFVYQSAIHFKDAHGAG